MKIVDYCVLDVQRVAAAVYCVLKVQLVEDSGLLRFTAVLELYTRRGFRFLPLRFIEL